MSKHAALLKRGLRSNSKTMVIPLILSPRRLPMLTKIRLMIG